MIHSLSAVIFEFLRWFVQDSFSMIIILIHSFIRILPVVHEHLLKFAICHFSILFFGVCSCWINSSFKCFHLFFSGVQISSAISSEPPSKSSQYFYLILSSFFLSHHPLSPEFFMVVLHDSTHSTRVHQDSSRRSSSIFLLAYQSAINSPYPFEVEFCIFSFFSAIQSFPFVAGYHLMISRSYP